MRADDRLFGQFLVDAGLLTRSQLGDLSHSSAPLSKTLVDLGLMGEDEVRRAQAHALGVPFAVVDPHDIPVEALALIPEPLARSREIIAFAADEARVLVAVLDLADLDALSALEADGGFGGRRVVPHLTTRETLKRALLKYQKHLRDTFGELLSDGRHVAEALIGHALYSRAGGAHVDISTHGALVRYQVGHALHEAMRLPAQAGHALARELKILARLLPVARPQQGAFAMDKHGDTVHVNVSVVPTVGGERIHMRLARRASGAEGYTLEALGLHGEGLAALRLCLGRRRGLVAVSGAPRSGKSALLYAMLDLLQHPGVSVATVEERILRRLPHAAQTELKDGISSGAALRAALRQHPDVLLLGHVRDQESASLAAAAAARGIFVLAASDSADEGLLSDAAGALVRVALARRLATDQFAVARPLSRPESVALEGAADFARVYEALKDEQVIEQGVAWKDIAFARPTPSTGHPDGYSGVVGLQEVIAPGFDTLNIAEDALFKAAQGLTSAEEAIRLSAE